MPIPTLGFQSPYAKIFGTSLNYSKLKIFGYLCYPWLISYSSHKFDKRSSSCVFLGYSLSQNAYLCFDPSCSKMYISCHIQFVESVFPYMSLNTTLDRPSSATVSSWLPPITTISSSHASQLPSTPPSVVLSHESSPYEASTSSPPTDIEQLTLPAVATSTPVAITSLEPPPSSSQADITAALLVPQAVHTTPSTLVPTHLLQSSPSSTPQPTTSAAESSSLATVTVPQQVNDHHMTTRAKNNIHKPIQKLNLHTHLQPTPDCEPTTELAPSEMASNIVGCKWIFRIKRKSDGSIDRFKARLVTKGFNQPPGVDYFETFSPVIKPTTVRLVLNIAISHGWPLRQLDINNAFLQGHLTETVFMAQPLGFIDSDHPTHVCKLKKAIYGLKQAPRAWYHELCQFLLTVGFKNSYANTSLFVLNSGGNILHLLIYVDDIILTGNNAAHVNRFVESLA
ncbi:hypothetical protein QYF36_022495 [Acer negundo]|nr:hypothetical protein QYF36_022495 [Acer negundo]